MVAIFLIVVLGMGVALYYQLHYGPVGTSPASNGSLFVIMALSILIGINFSAIRIHLTDIDVRVSYGLFGKTLAWRDVASCEIDTSSVLRYGGWGIRLGMIQGKAVWVYNTFGGKRVAFLTKANKPKGMVVTTQNSEELIRISNQLIGMKKERN